MSSPRRILGTLRIMEHRCMQLYMQGEYQLALEWAQKALAIGQLREQRQAILLYWQGRCYAALCAEKEAEESLLQATQIAAGLPDRRLLLQTQESLSSLYAKTGKAKEAYDALLFCYQDLWRRQRQLCQELYPFLERLKQKYSFLAVSQIAKAWHWLEKTWSPTEEVFAADVCTQIQQQYASCDWGILQLAAQMGLSTRTLHRRFSQVFGCSFARLLDRFRLQMAYEFLHAAQGKQQVRQIAQLVGYRSPSHFALSFRQEFGLSPSMILAQKR